MTNRWSTTPEGMLARFESKIEKDAPGGCWLWTAAVDDSGYARLDPAIWGEKRGHRWSYKTFVGPIPDDLTIDHLCMVKRCVNPAHLEPVTLSENSLRFWATVTHCRRGLHVMDEQNSRSTGNGQRTCRACATERRAARMADPAYRAEYNAKKNRANERRRDEINRRARERYAAQAERAS